MPQRLEGGRAVVLKQKRRKPAPSRPVRVAAPKPLVQSVATARKPGLEPVVARKKRDVARAENRALGKPVEPHVPLLRRPTNKQKAEAIRIYNRSRNAQLPKGVKGAAKTKAIYDFAERQKVARQDEKLEAGRRAVRGQERSLALQVLRQGGDFKGRPGSKERVERGKKIIAALPKAQARAGDTHRRVRLPGATIDLTVGANAVAQKIARGPGDAPGQFVLNAVKDVGTLGQAPFVAGVEIGKAGVALSRGDTRPAVRLAKGTAEGLINSSPGLLLRGRPGAAAEAFREHPLLEALNFAGGIGAAGRVGGAVARGAGSNVEAAGVRGALARAGSTARSPVTASESGAPVILKERSLSKDILRAGAQRRADARREPLLDEHGNPVMVRRGGRDVPVLKAKGTVLGAEPGARAWGPFRSEKQRIQDAIVDRAANRADAVNRMVQSETPQAERKLYGGRVRGRMRQQDRDVVGYVRSGTVRPASFMEDVRKERQRVEAAYVQHLEAGGNDRGGTGGTLTRAEVQANRRNAQLLDDFLGSNPSAQRVAAIVGTARQSARASVENDRALVGVLGADKDRLKQARLSEYAMAHMGARFREAENAAVGRDTLRLRTADGKPLQPQQIEAHARAHGVDPDELAHLPHRMEELGSAAYYRQFRPGQRGGVPKARRTGELYERGGVTHKQQAVIDARVKQESSVERAKQVDKFVKENAVVRPGGEPFSGRQADEVIRQLKEQTGEDYVKVSLAPAALPERVRRGIIEGLDMEGAESLPQQLLASRKIEEGAGAHNVGIIPARMMRRMEQQLAPANDFVRFLQGINRAFRYAVLPQPRWLTGNFVEPFFVRLPAVGSGAFLPGLAMDLRAMQRIKKVGKDPEFKEAMRQIEADHLGGLLFSARGASVKRGAEDLPGIVRRLGGYEHVPAVTHMLQMGGRAFLAPFKVVFEGNKFIERGVQNVALGHRARREVQEVTGSWLKAANMGREAAEEVLRGITDGPKANQFLDYANETLGKYSGFSPGMRMATQTVAPFLPWFLNAARFVYWTMPVHHTVATAFLLNVEKAYHQEWEDQHKDVPPGGLKVAVPRKDGGLVDVARYTPFGLTAPLSQGEFKGLADPLLPQGSGAISALSGNDPFDRPLKVSKDSGDKSGTPTPVQKAQIAGYGLLEGFVPGLAMGRRLREGGGTSLGNSTIFQPRTKPDSSHGMSAANRTFNPFRPTYLRAKKGSSSQGGAEGAALQREARELLRQQQSPAERAEAEALQREARALLRSQR